MAKFKCPRCSNHVEAANPQGLVCPNCGYPGDKAAPAAPTWQPAPNAAPPGNGQWQTPPPYMAITGPICPRCNSGHTKKGSIPVWAIVLAVLFCPIGLLFLLVKDENHCYNCGMQWKN